MSTTPGAEPEKQAYCIRVSWYRSARMLARPSPTLGLLLSGCLYQRWQGRSRTAQHIVQQLDGLDYACYVMSDGHASSKRRSSSPPILIVYLSPYTTLFRSRCPRHPARNRRSRPTAYEFLGIAPLACSPGRVPHWDCSFLVAFIRDGKGAVERHSTSYNNSMVSTTPAT